MSSNQEWLSPINKLKFREAVKAKAPTVVLRYNNENRVFNLRYNGTRTVVHFYPVRGELVPRGYFNIDKILLDSWLEE